MRPVIDDARDKFAAIIAENKLNEEAIRVDVGQLSAEEAIGITERKDFPLLEGKEVIVEARFRDSFGHAFTSQPHAFQGTLGEVLDLDLTESGNRAVFISTLNAVTAYLGLAEKVRHCRNEEPEICGREMADGLRARFGPVKVGLIGLQPAILENLARTFGSDNVKCTDMNPKNIATEKYGVEIWDGRRDTKKIIQWGKLLLVTSSTMVNGTFDYINREAASQGKTLIVFGVSGAGIAALTGIERICLYGH